MALDRELTKFTRSFPSKLSISGTGAPLETRRNEKTSLCFESGTWYLYVHTRLCIQSDMLVTSGSFTANNNETHHQCISAVPIEEQSYTMPAP